MIQVSKRSFDGSIAFCRINEILHDLAIQKAKEDNFLMANAKIEDVKNCNQMRRMALHDSLFDSEDEETKELYGIRAVDRIAARREAEELYGKSMASATSNLRSLLCFNLMPKVSQLMLLRVLSDGPTGFLQHHKKIKVVSDTGRTKSVHELEKFGHLSLLRYVELSLVIYSIKDMDNFQKFIGGMRFLQTLDLRSGIIRGDLPDCVWFVKTIRHVLLPKRPGFISGPPPSVDLTGLQTLFVVQCRESWETAGLPQFRNVRTLGIRSCFRFHWDIVFSLLGTLDHLISLEIVGGSVPLNIIDMRDFPFYHRLHNLDLENENWRCHKKIALGVGMFPINLTTLRLQYVQFCQDPMPVLEELDNLRSLFLGGSKFSRLSNSAGGFSQLEVLDFFKLEELKEWRIQEGAMPKLKELKVSNCPMLCVPPGLQHLTVLQKLTWNSWNSYGKMDKTIENEILSICKHVPSIIVAPM